MFKIPESCSPVNVRAQLEAAVLEAETTLQRTMELRFAELLMAVVFHVLGRPYHRRRKRVSHRLHQLIHLDAGWDGQDVPPALQIDAIWATILRANGQVRRDRRGRKRPVKGRFKCPIFIAMGVWPEENRCEILLWQVGTGENAEDWVRFLEILEAQGFPVE